MFIWLPIYFGLGTAGFYCWRFLKPSVEIGLGRRSPRLFLNADAIAALTIALIIVVLVGIVVWLCALRWPLSWYSVGFALSAVIVGAVGAENFEDSRKAGAPNSRDRSIFIGTVALFQIIAALEFDYKIISHLTKFSAGSVSLELSQQQKPGNESQKFQVIGGATEAAFSRSKGLFYVTNQLQLLGEDISKDEQFAEISAHVDSRVWGLDDATAHLQAFACAELTPMATQLLELQARYKSEFPRLSDIPQISLSLRRFYFLQSGLLEAGGDSTFGGDRSSGSEDTAGLLRTALEGFSMDIGREIVAIGEREKDLSGADKAKHCPQSWQPNTYHFLSERGWSPKVFLFLAEGKNNWPPQAQFPAVLEPSAALDPASSNYLGYLAALAAFVEFADGNRESAIQLLDERIRQETKYLKKVDKSPGGKKEALSRLRKQTLLLRLIYWEGNLIPLALSQTPDSTALRKIAFDRYQNYIAIASDLLSNIDKDYAARKAIHAKAASGDRTACPANIKIEGLSDPALFFSFTFAIAVEENNAIWTAATNREIVLSRPELVNVIDPWVEDVKSLNLECLKTLGVDLPSDVRVNLWESVGVYLELRGRSFFAPESRDLFPAPDSEETFKSSCGALAAFREAKKAMLSEKSRRSATARSDELTGLDLELSGFRDASYELEFDDKIDALTRWIKNNYPAGQVSPGCLNAP